MHAPANRTRWHSQICPMIHDSPFHFHVATKSKKRSRDYAISRSRHVHVPTNVPLSKNFCGLHPLVPIRRNSPYLYVPIIRVQCKKSIEIKSKVRLETIGDDSIAFVGGGGTLGEQLLLAGTRPRGHAARCPRAPVALTGFRHPHAVSPHQTHK